jgi:hypothetical protein
LSISLDALGVMFSTVAVIKSALDILLNVVAALGELIFSGIASNKPNSGVNCLGLFIIVMCDFTSIDWAEIAY